MKPLSLPNRLFQLAMLIFLVLITACCSLSKNLRTVKHQYPHSWEAINQLAVQQAPLKEVEQEQIKEKQCRAFLFLSEKWNKQTSNHRQIIEVALYRWGWLPGDTFPDCKEVVDYWMVYMEFLQKTGSATP